MKFYEIRKYEGTGKGELQVIKHAFFIQQYTSIHNFHVAEYIFNQDCSHK